MTTLLRIADEGDAAGVWEIYAPIVRDTVISFELEPPDLDEIRRRIQTTLELAPWLVCEADGRTLGYAYGGRFRARPAYRWAVETAVYVHPDARRRGVATALYDALLAGLRRQGFHTALAGITLPNPASVRLHERLGFTSVGSFREVGRKQGAWHDVGFWELPLVPAVADPAPPLPVSDLARTPEWDEALTAAAARVR